MEIRVQEHSAHIVIVTIDNQPRLNAMTRHMMAELACLWDTFEQASYRCIILTGAGEWAFCAGADISGDLSADVEMAKIVNHALLKHHAFSKPMIAAVNGDYIGGGVELLLSTDIRATVPRARFGLPEVRWSIYPFGGATVKLIQQIGYVHAMELLLTAKLIDAASAVQIGLINRIVPAEALMPWALETAEMIAANSPAAVQAVKQQISTTRSCHPCCGETDAALTELSKILGLVPEEARLIPHELAASGLPFIVQPDTDYIAAVSPFSSIPTPNRIAVEGGPATLCICGGVRAMPILHESLQCSLLGFRI